MSEQKLHTDGQAFADAMMVALDAVAAELERKGEMPTINALMGALVAVAAFHIAGVDDARARKALLREMEKELPRAVARQRTHEGGLNRGKVVIVEKGRLN